MGSAYAMFAMARMHDDGQGTKIDKAKSAELHLKSYRGGIHKVLLKFYSSISKPTRLLIQKRLGALGYYTGITDGEFGTETINALERYAKEAANKHSASGAKAPEKKHLEQNPKPKALKPELSEPVEDMKDLERLD